MKCVRPECSPPGDIEDGYCDQCGLAPARESRGTTSGTAPIATNGGASSRRASRRTEVSRGRLGAGLVEIPTVAARDPASAVLVDPSVPEDRRFCSACDESVGRHRGEAPGRTDGFCRRCGHAFAFTPKLAAGDLVAGQYAVAGCLAHGGLGWIYLAQDRNVSDKWVVLKGLLNTSDDDALAAALAERRFLAEVDHPNIVKIINFVEHKHDGYIVMEYVAGTSLKGLLEARREANNDQPDPLPAAHAIAYILEILPALGHLHEHGLLFCDFKPDNVIQTARSLTLIDLGGVYRMDDEASPVYGTPGYQAPEIAQTGPTIASDLYTVGRTLAVLCTDFRGYQQTYKSSLPPQDAVPLYTAHDSLYRFLERATAIAPDDRFQNAEEMAEQLRGVLREVVASEQGQPVGGASTVFTGELHTAADSADWHALPMPLIQTGDPAATLLATIATSDSGELLELLARAPEGSTEVVLRRVRVFIDDASFDDADNALATLEAEDPWEWRVGWYRGLEDLARGAPEPAYRHFTSVYRTLPGELAPKLALALAAELQGDDATAAQWYDIVSRTHAGFTTAAFGLARCRVRLDDRSGAVAALDRVESTSSAYVDAQIASARVLVPEPWNGTPQLTDVIAAARIIEVQPIDNQRRCELGALVFEASLIALQQNGTEPLPDACVLGRDLTERDLRLGLEEMYRALARYAPDASRRIMLIDRANHVRPRTLT